MGIVGGLLCIAVFISIIILIVYFTTRGTVFTENKEIKRLKKRLDDPRIYDPETDTYITLEEAESGVWDIDDSSKKRTSKEIEETFHEQEIIVQDICRELEREGFVKAKNPLSEEQFTTFEKLKLLDQLDENWGYSNFYERDTLTAIILNIHHTSEFAVSMLVKDVSGHYVFKEKTVSDRILDTIRPDDDIKVENYECYTIQKTKTTRAVENIMFEINKHKHIEVEVLPGQLFIKTTRPVQSTDLFMLLNLTRKIMRSGY